MKSSLIRKKRVVIPATLAVAALAVGGTVWIASADEVTGDERDRVAAAAVTAVNGERAGDVERSDDEGGFGEAYEVEVLLKDGSQVDVLLDEQLALITTDPDDDDSDDSDDRDDRDDQDDLNDVNDAADRMLSDAERSSAEAAAVAAVPGSTVVDVDASDDRGVAYEVEVRDVDGLEWDIDLDADFTVVGKYADR